MNRAAPSALPHDSDKPSNGWSLAPEPTQEPSQVVLRLPERTGAIPAGYPPAARITVASAQLRGQTAEKSVGFSWANAVSPT